jgi:pilus assembly protein CpaC
VYVADPNILNSVTLSPNQIVVTAMTSGISSLVLMDEAGLAQSYVVSSDLDVAGLRVAMSEAMHGDAVNIEGSGDRVTLSGTVGSAELADTAVKLAGLYSKQVANALTIAPEHPKQVRLKVRILEVDRTRAQQYGINLFNPGGNTSFLAAATTSQYPSTATLSQSALGANAIGQLATTSPLNFMLYSSKLNLGTTIQDLESKQILQILAEPTITTISGQKADFLSGGEFPFPMVQPGGTGSAPVVTVQFRQYGVKLEFTPIVNDDGTIRLTVAPEVSSLDYTNSVTIGGFTVPALSTRRAETQVELRSDQSFAISGLLDQRTTDLLSKTPGVASIPILGALFKSKNVNHSTTELVVIVTPTLVDPLNEAEEPAQPEMPIPILNKGSFDKSLGKDKSTHPTAPPINPQQPPTSNEVPATTPATSAPSAGTGQDVTPEQAPQNSPASSPANPATVAGVRTEPSIASAQRAGTGTPQRPAKYIYDSPATVADGSGNAIAAPSAPVRSMVQIMTLSSSEDAESMVAALKRHGYNVAVNHDPLDSLLHLEVGPFESKSDAEAMRRRLVLDGYNATVR